MDKLKFQVLMPPLQANHSNPLKPQHLQLAGLNASITGEPFKHMATVERRFGKGLNASITGEPFKR